MSPGLHDLRRARIGVATVDQLCHPVQVNPLQRKGSQFTTVDQRNGGAQRRVAADRVHGVHRPGQRQIAEVDAVRRAVLDQVQGQCRGAQLEIGRRLGKVGVADDHV